MRPSPALYAVLENAGVRRAGEGTVPELPEVETVRRTLARRIAGEQIADVEIRFPGCVEGNDSEFFREKVIGRVITRVERRGKYLLLRLDDGSAVSVHLRMTGRLTAERNRPPAEDKYLRAEFVFASGLSLRFHDVRKFGRIGWHAGEEELSARIAVGPDPTGSEFSASDLLRIASGRKRPIKSLLLDQRLIGGLGNIYADESLFRAGIAPDRPAGSLSSGEIEALHAAVRDVLAEGIRYKGTTLRDYVDGDGRAGNFQERLKVYGREGKPCTKCETPIVRIKLAGRSAFYCPGCQK